ncbi:high affinity immunoglobulin gamma Fc receptor I-like [Mastacembelus armatus]|uniref:high affinity immunoglobulin gamma Fc receptor I-like n=1 Tax=Mastacembelus armatus TaxID=205130 RepID=UPI000E460EB9|nr:high affinity immunoglobulin gamma Fc receptor I-like [Mastacembelus armatus]
MKPPAVSLLLGVSVLLLSGLTVSAVSLNLNLSPNLQQFFSGDSVSLSCVEDGQTGGGWTVKRTVQGSSQQCGRGHDFGNVVGSSCVLSPVSPSDSGLYWCEHTSGLSSDRISISISEVILNISALPVQTGNNVTLRCRNKQDSTVPAYFYRNGSIIETRSDTEFTISKVQQSDEGLYSCSPDLVQQSPQIWLMVKDPPTTTSDPPTTTSSSSSSSSSSSPSAPLPTDSSSLSPPPPPPPVSVVRLLCHLLVFSPYCVCTVLMVSICCSRKTE